MAANYPLIEDVNLNELHNDLNQAMYMLHHVDEDIFSREEIRAVCFSLKVIMNSVDKMKKKK